MFSPLLKLALIVDQRITINECVAQLQAAYGTMREDMDTLQIIVLLQDGADLFNATLVCFKRMNWNGGVNACNQALAIRYRSINNNQLNGLCHSVCGWSNGWFDLIILRLILSLYRSGDCGTIQHDAGLQCQHQSLIGGCLVLSLFPEHLIEKIVGQSLKGSSFRRKAGNAAHA